MNEQADAKTLQSMRHNKCSG